MQVQCGVSIGGCMQYHVALQTHTRTRLNHENDVMQKFIFVVKNVSHLPTTSRSPDSIRV